MKKEDVTKLLKDIQIGVSKRSPEILTSIGIAGMIGTTVLAVKATPKALKLIEEKKKEEHKNELTALETVKTTWKCYIPAAISGAASISCIIGASSVNAKRNAALATAYKLSETAFSEYKAKVVETIGEKKEQAVKDKIAQDKVENKPVNSANVIVTGNGNTLCFDGVFGQYFESNIEAIKKAVNKMNYRMLGEQYVSLNDLYEELGIDKIDVGNMVGWNVSRHGMLEVSFSSTIAKDGRPCIVLDYNVAPQYNYDRYL